MWAARSDAIEAMTALLDGGADPNARDLRNGWTPLLHAIHRRHVDAVRVLLERGADPNLRNELLTPFVDGCRRLRRHVREAATQLTTHLHQPALPCSHGGRACERCDSCRGLSRSLT